jgi:DNA ligase-associated metallophosphoesterase
MGTQGSRTQEHRAESDPQHRAGAAGRDGGLAFEWGGESFIALGERAIWWGRRQTLCVADLHLGKAAAFRAAGVPVPEQGTAKDLRVLSALIERFNAQRLVILGDLIHAASGRVAVTMDAVTSWRERHADIDILLVRGNHDVRAGDPPREWRMRVLTGPCGDEGDGSVQFAHDPREANKVIFGPGQSKAPGTVEARVVMCGHLHPAVALEGGATGMRTRCFWLRRDGVGVLPAFGSFTGSKCVGIGVGDRVFAVGDGVNAVMDVTPTPRKTGATSSPRPK